MKEKKPSINSVMRGDGITNDLSVCCTFFFFYNEYVIYVEIF